MQIYAETDGANWKLKEHWGEKEGEVCERWKGVVCDRMHMHVTSLVLHLNQLKGFFLFSALCFI
jgi:hypothetical protein